MFLHENLLEKMVSNMKLVFDAMLFLTLYSGVVLLNPESSNVVANLIASIAGATTLAYFRRDRDYRELFFKSASAAISGYVVGALLVRWYDIETQEYKFATFFFAALLSLFLLRGLVSVTDQNANGFIISIIQKFIPPISGYKIVPTDSPNADLGTRPTLIETKVKVKKDGDSEVIAEKKIHEKEK
jgi:hypothetical protein